MDSFLVKILLVIGEMHIILADDTNYFYSGFCKTGTVTSMVGVLLREGDFVSFLIFDLNAELDFLTFN